MRVQVSRNPDEQLQRLLREVRRLPTKQNIEKLASAANRAGEVVFLFLDNVSHHQPCKGFIIYLQNGSFWAKSIDRPSTAWQKYELVLRANATGHTGYDGRFAQELFDQFDRGISIYLSRRHELSVNDIYQIFEQKQRRNPTRDRICKDCRWALPMFRHNPDKDLRDAEREVCKTGGMQAVVALIQHRLRAGLPTEYVVVAGKLGHRAAQLVIPSHTIDWTNQIDRSILFEGLLDIDYHLMVRILCDLAETMLGPWEVAYPKNRTFHDGIMAMRRLIAGTYTGDDRKDVARAVHFAYSVSAGFFPSSSVEYHEAGGSGPWRDCTPSAVNSALTVAYVLRMYCEESSVRLGAGDASSVKPFPATKERFRIQALFIADRLLGLAPVK